MDGEDTAAFGWRVEGACTARLCLARYPGAQRSPCRKSNSTMLAGGVYVGRGHSDIRPSALSACVHVSQDVCQVALTFDAHERQRAPPARDWLSSTQHDRPTNQHGSAATARNLSFASRASQTSPSTDTTGHAPHLPVHPPTIALPPRSARSPLWAGDKTTQGRGEAAQAISPQRLVAPSHDHLRSTGKPARLANGRGPLSIVPDVKPSQAPSHLLFQAIGRAPAGGDVTEFLQ